MPNGIVGESIGVRVPPVRHRRTRQITWIVVVIVTIAITIAIPLHYRKRGPRPGVVHGEHRGHGVEAVRLVAGAGAFLYLVPAAQHAGADVGAPGGVTPAPRRAGADPGPPGLQVPAHRLPSFVPGMVRVPAVVEEVLAVVGHLVAAQPVHRHPPRPVAALVEEVGDDLPGVDVGGGVGGDDGPEVAAVPLDGRMTGSGPAGHEGDVVGNVA